MLDIPKRTQSKLKLKRVILVIMSWYVAIFSSLEFFLRGKRVRILLSIINLSFFTPVNTLLELASHKVHLSDNTLDPNQLISHTTV